jgi:hypothetical protein
MNEKVLRYWASASIEILLWVVLLFCFDYDYKREDFVFIPINASYVLAVIAALSIRRIIINTINKWTK